MKCSENLLYYNLSFEFDYKVFNGRLRIKIFGGSEDAQRLSTTSYPRDVDLRNGSRQKGRESTPAK
jgi:hypothetical protein